MSARDDGKSVSKEKQLTGIWLATTDGEFAGVEFLKDNQAMVTSGGGMTQTLTYSLLEGGRLSLVNAQGATSLYKATMSDTGLTLAPEQQTKTAQSFEKLPSGQTLAEGIRLREERLVEQMKRRILNLSGVVTKGGVVLITEGPEDTGWIMSLDFTDPDASLNGVLTLDQSPSKPDVLRPVLRMPFRGDTRAADKRTDRVSIVMNAGPATEPAGQENVTGTVRLTIGGPIDSPEITGTAQFPQLWPQPRAVTLMTDPEKHARPVERLEAQRGAREQELARMRAFLGGRANFVGERAATGGPEPQSVRLVVEQDAEGKGYTATADVGGKPDQQAQTSMDLVLGQAAFYVTFPTGEQWRLQTTETEGAFEGAWRPNTRADFISGGTISLRLEQSWSPEQLAEERARIEGFLTQGMSTPQRFLGLVESAFGPDKITRWPVVLELKSGPDNALSGSAWLVAQNGGVSLTGTRQGIGFSLASSGVLEGSADLRRAEAQKWQLTLAAMDPLPVIKGNLVSSGVRGGRVVFEHATPDSLSELRRKLAETVSGHTFIAERTETSSDRDYGTYFRFSFEPATGEVTGEAIGAGPGIGKGIVPPALFHGAIEDVHGFPTLRGTLTTAPDPSRGRDGTPTELTLCLVELSDGSRLLTGSCSPTSNIDWFALTPVDASAQIATDPVDDTRLKAFRLGASAVAPTDPKPGEEHLVIVEITERDLRVGQLFYADGRYTHRNSIPAAAIHAGLAGPGEVGVFRLTYGAPFTSPVQKVEQNGITSDSANFKENNPLPTFTIERVSLD